MAGTTLATRRLDSTSRQHEDEGWWIVTGKLSWDVLFRHRDPRHPMWTDDLGSWGAPNPQLGKLLIGAGLAVSGDEPPVPLRTGDGSRALEPGEMAAAAAAQLGFDHYDFTLEPDQNRAAGRTPPPRILARARAPVLLAGLLAGALFWALARTLAGDLVAALALVLWTLSPALTDASSYAMTDAPALAGVLLGLLGAVRAARALRIVPGSAWKPMLVAACGFGLAISTKLNALAPLAGAVGVALGLLVHAALRDGAGRRALRAAAWPAMLLLIPLATAFASNPMLWTRPWSPLGEEPNRPSVLLSLAGKVASIDQPGRLETPTAKAVAAARFLVRHGDAFAGARIPFGAILALTGAVAAIRAWTRGRALGREADPGVVAFVAISASTWGMTIAWAPFVWERFFLPLLPAYTLAAAFGAATLVREVARRIPLEAAQERGRGGP